MAHPYHEAVKACATWIAQARIENANDNEEDVREYSTDAEVVMLYLKDLAEDISKLLPAEIAKQLEE
jgi:hypothetical protein